MSKPSHAGHERRCLEEAAIWFTRLQDPELPPTWWERWKKWHSLPENQAAFDSIATLMEELRRLPRLDMPHDEELAADRDHTARPIALEFRAARESRNVHWVRAAAPWVFTLSLALVLMWVSWGGKTIETGPGEWRTVQLADGSTATVGPRTSIKLEFDDRRRSLYLDQGEVMFAVAKNPARPFIVHTDLGAIRALGTRFAVLQIDRQVLVTVAEGQVSVTRQRANESFGQAVSLSADRQVEISSGEMTAVRSVDAERELESLTSGMITFEGTVAEAVEKFNRRNYIQLRIPDRTIGDIKIFGRFSLRDPERFASYVASEAGARVARDQPNILVVERDSQRKSPATRPPG